MPFGLLAVRSQPSNFTVIHPVSQRPRPARNDGRVHTAKRQDSSLKDLSQRERHLGRVSQRDLNTVAALRQNTEERGRARVYDTV